MKISIEGYKSIAQKRCLEIGGLTILSGANSSGKSSFMQPLLLIKQTLENDFDAGSLMLDGPNVKLTDSSQIISRVPSEEQGFFTVSISNEKTETIASYKFWKKRGIHIDSIVHRSDEFKDGIRIHLGLKPSEIESLFISEHFTQIKQILGKEKKVTWKVVRDRCFLELQMQVGAKSFPFGGGFTPARNLELLSRRLIHVPGLRGNPERSYKVAISESVYPGSFEKYVASIIHKWKFSKSKGEKAKFETLREQLKFLGLASSIETVSINDTSLEIRISRHSGSTSTDLDHVNIADVGFGVSQTLPVLVALLAANKDQVVYIEQPELHLHPRAQFNLATIIANAVAERNINVVIETHSSILIRGVQILVAKRQLDAKSVSLNWFTQDPQSGQTNITEAKLDKYGAFGDWPEDFDSVSLEVETMYLDSVEEALENEV
ncbi:AAA family ATPase [Methylomicrobium lacus]|uniref:AAA family ATPase n=1 Tax=Methylomicrobium lacus TaxID=136992 RepID=UPI0035A97B6D